MDWVRHVKGIKMRRKGGNGLSNGKYGGRERRSNVEGVNERRRKLGVAC